MKRLVVLILTGCLLLSLASCSLLQKKQTLYVVTGQKQYVDGQLRYSATFEYDDHGRPLVVDLEKDGERMLRSELKYDKYGNPIRESVTQILSGPEYRYTTDYNLTYAGERLTRVETLREGEQMEALNLHYDSDNRLVLVEYDAQEDKAGHLWQSYVYDEDGRLIRETRCTRYPGSRWADEQFSYNQVRYSYDVLGRLTEQCFLSPQKFMEKQLTPEEAETLDFDVSEAEHYFFYYDNEGRLAYVGDGPEDTYPGGSAEIYSDKDYTFDENGNLVRVQWDERRWEEYTYEAIELAQEDAVMAKRLMHGVHNTMTQYTAFAQMDPLFWNICPPTLYRYHLCTSQVYYLVPYPQFELFLDK